MAVVSQNSFQSRTTFSCGSEVYTIFSLREAERNGLKGISRLPFSLKILLENLLRWEDGVSVTRKDIESLAAWLVHRHMPREIAYHPARVLMQDFTGVPAVVDLAAMRDAMLQLGGKAESIHPHVPVDLIIDHSVAVDFFGSPEAFRRNVQNEYMRNKERYAFLRWGQSAFDRFRVVPPGTGICHQVNLEYLAKTVWCEEISGEKFLYPDTLVGTDSHTTMVNSLAVLGWGVGGIEAEAAMLGQPISMLIPDVVGFRLEGSLPEGTTATDLVLTIAERLRAHGVVGKFVEFYGTGLSNLSLEDTATIANMAPEFGASLAFFPVDEETLAYLRATGRSEAHIALVESYTKEQGLFRDETSPDPLFTETLSLVLSEVVPCIAGPKRPQDRIILSQAATSFRETCAQECARANGVSVESILTHPPDQLNEERLNRFSVPNRNHDLGHGDVVIAAITSCTNTSNPAVLMAAGLLARNARRFGLQAKPWVRTSLAPGSQVVTDYLEKAGLQKDLDALGFNLVGYGCTTCIGNSGNLDPEIAEVITIHKLTVCSVLSGNRNFEGRINPYARANYLASPPLVVAYALAGSLFCDLTKDPLGHDKEGTPVFLRDLWPSAQEVARLIRECVAKEMFEERYKDVFKGDTQWQEMTEAVGSITYDWPTDSTYIKKPPFFEGMSRKTPGIQDIVGARILAIFGDSLTTDHISPAGSIPKESPAGLYLQEKGIRPEDFNSYGARRGNHEVMLRGTFANIRIRNKMVDGREGGFTRHMPEGQEMPIYEAALRYQEEGIPLVIFAGKEYGTGSSRDWAAKGTRFLGVRAVIAESFERIHRSNLVGMGVLPLAFKEGTSCKTLHLTGAEKISLLGLEEMTPGQEIQAHITYADGIETEVPLLVRVDTSNELAYLRAGGILQYVLRGMLG